MRGELAERSNAAVLKTVDLNGSGGSNPSLSAICFFVLPNGQRQPPIPPTKPVMKYKQIDFRNNTLCHGDCLDILQKWAEQGHKVDLIYLDPPFNSNASYNILFGKDAQGKALDDRAQFVAFDDTWNWSEQAHKRVKRLCAVPYQDLANAMQGLKLILGEGGMLSYVSYMAERLVWMREILKDTGSIYFHCDPTASHYMKAAMDGIFGAKNFRNEMVWCYRERELSHKQWNKKHDIILFYTKSNQWNFNWREVAEEYSEYTVAKKFKYIDEDGRRYRLRYKDGRNDPRQESEETYRQYMEVGVPPRDWVSIPILNQASRERLGYPTQKPLALLNRIVKASSNKDEIVLDPFCGCGTTAEAAWKLRRKFIGIDISPYAVTEVCRRRLKNAEGVTVQGLPMDIKSAADLGAADPFVFEKWAVSCFPGFLPNEKQTGDGGIDGRGFLLHEPVDEKGEPITKQCVAQVKVTRPTTDAIRALLSQVTGGHAAIGVFITLNKLNETKTMRDAINDAGTLAFKGGTEIYPRMVFWSMEEYFAGVFPKLPERGHPITGKSIAQTEINGSVF